MTPIIEKYIGKEALEQAVSQNKYNDESYKEFIRYLDFFLTELELDNAIEEEDTATSLLCVPIDHANYFAQKRYEGFSEAWSRKYAECKTADDTRNLLVYCYETVKEQSMQQADADLMNYFKLTNRDQQFIDYFLKRLAGADRYVNTSLEKDVEEFISNYKEKINEGKSEIYACQYADWLLDDYHPIFCEDYAYIYDDSIKKGKSVDYAKEYAYEYASKLVNVKRRYGISDDEESLGWAKSNAKAHINAWEYANENGIDIYGKFIECYKREYLGLLYPDGPKAWKSIEECEKIAIEKALAEYERMIKSN